MSASNKPTRAPLCASATAILTDIVDLPTPPLPEPTAIALRIGMLTSPRIRPSLGTSESSLTSTFFTPTTASTASRVSFSIRPRNGQAGVVSMTVKETLSPAISRLRIMLRVTRS